MQVNAAPIPPKETAAKVLTQSLPKPPEKMAARATPAPVRPEEPVVSATMPSPRTNTERDAARADEILRQMYGQATVEVRTGAPVAPPATAPSSSTNPTVEITVAAATVPQNSTLATTIDESLLDAMGKTIARVKAVVVADTADRSAAALRALEILQLLRGYAEARTRLPFIFEGDPLHNEFMGRIRNEIDSCFDPKNGGSGERPSHQNMQMEDRNSSNRAAGRQLPRSSGSRVKDSR